MTTPTSIYMAIMLELERRRVALGLPMEKFSEWAGLPDRYYPKALHSYTPSGRQAQWPTVELIVNALFPAGYDVVIVPKPGQVIRENDLKAKLLRLKALVDPVSQRELMRQLGHAGRAQQLQQQTEEKRKRIARNAAKVRWRRVREAKRAAAIIVPTQIPSA